VNDDRGLRLGLLMRQGELRTFDGRVIRLPVGWSELRDMAQAAEAVGFDTLFLADHLLFRDSPPVQMPPGETRDVYECFTLLSALAASTERVGLGPLVACNGFRNPGLLAKMAQALEEVSGGRLILGLGAGWHRPEYDAFGYPYDHRVSRFAEALAIIAPLLRQGQVDFRGQYYEARACELHLRGPRPGGPPIWIGGSGPRMMRLIARYADAFNTVWYREPAEVAEPFSRLESACREVGRDPSGVGRTAGTFVVVPGPDAMPSGPPSQTFAGQPEQVAERLRAFHAAGVDHLTIVLDPWDVRGIERFGEVIAALRR
jgi:probable F420-dependent oxidoreductase